MNIHWYFEPFCDLDFDHKSPIFSQNNWAHDDVPSIWSNQVQLQKDQQFRWYIKKSYFDYMILDSDLDLEDSKPIFLEDTVIQKI